jgi:hypothetical protein
MHKKISRRPARSRFVPPSATCNGLLPKTPVDVVLEQIGKQEKKVATLQKELDQEKTLLGKLAKAKAALEA